MVEFTLQTLVIAAHLVGICLASTLNPFGIAAGAALTHPEQTGGIAYEFVKNSINSVVKGLTNKEDEHMLDPDEAERASKAMSILGRAQLRNKSSSTGLFIQPPSTFAQTPHYTAVYAEDLSGVDNNLVLPTVMPGRMDLALQSVRPNSSEDERNTKAGVEDRKDNSRYLKDELTVENAQSVKDMVETGVVNIRKRESTSYQSFDPNAAFVNPLGNSPTVELPLPSACMKAAEILSRNVADKTNAAREAMLKKLIGWSISGGLGYALQKMPEIPGVKIDAQAISDSIVERFVSSPVKSVQTVNGNNGGDENENDIKQFLSGLSQLIVTRSVSDYILVILLLYLFFTRQTGVYLRSDKTLPSSMSKDISNQKNNPNDVKKNQKRISRAWLEEKLNNMNLKDNKKT
jgi:hypothetical protein